MVPISGTVDRKFGVTRIAGVYGFSPPPGANELTRDMYRRLVRNRPWKPIYREYGYWGLHGDATSLPFIREVVAPLLMKTTPKRESEDQPAHAAEQGDSVAPREVQPAVDTSVRPDGAESERPGGAQAAGETPTSSASF
jgi:hypothetical protein